MHFKDLKYKKVRQEGAVKRERKQGSKNTG